MTAAALALGAATRRLRLLGAAPSDLRAYRGSGSLILGDTRAVGIAGHIGSGGEPAGEATSQALTGLAALHGRASGGPARLGLEVASVTAGVLASQALLAAQIGRLRGLDVARVDTSLPAAALLYAAHHVAVATTGPSRPEARAESGPGPPFATADGCWVELEVLAFEEWERFWTALDAGGTALADAWSSFARRYVLGRCALPAELHRATRRHTLAELRAVASATGAVLCAVRGYPEVLRDAAGWSDPPWTIEPWTIEPGPPATGRRSAPCTAPLRPLTGLRVVELTTRLQGPLAGLLLAMLGADVVKVEPLGGDSGRIAPGGPYRAAYLAYNRGKNVFELDYTLPAGRRELHELAAGADVFLHNARPGRAERVGFDAAGLRRVNDALVHVTAAGWRRDDGAPGEVAGDFVVQAHAGCGHGLAAGDRPPWPSRVTLLDVMGGLIACEGALAGLLERERSGAGVRVRTSLYAAAMTLQWHVLDAVARGDEHARVLGRPTWSALDGPIATRAGHLMVDVDDGADRGQLATLCGLPPNVGAAATAERLAERTADEWEAALLATGVPGARVRADLGALPRDARVAPLLEPLDGGGWAPTAPWRFAL